MITHKEIEGHSHRKVSIFHAGSKIPSVYIWYCPCCKYGRAKESYALTVGNMITHLNKFHDVVGLNRQLQVAVARLTDE
jgi:hypothetical protein